MRQIIVTGASGFVGRNLCPYLAGHGWHVVPVSMRDQAWKSRLPDDAEAIIHLAGLAHDLRNTRKADEYFRINTELTAELFDVFLASRIKKFVYLSSVKAAADAVGDRKLDEDYPATPATPYGMSKRKAEEHILSKDPGTKRVYVLRPCMIHGPGNKGNLNLLYRLLSLGLPWPLAGFDNARSFLSIENFNFVLQEICSRDIAPGLYNVSDSEYLSTLEVVEIIRRAIHSRAPAWRVNKTLVRGLARIGSRLQFPFNEERLAKLTESYVVDNRKILRAVGRPLPLTAQSGLAQTIQSFAR
jgi:nucleoside-diphosphate-sugar epimerase